MNTGKGRKDHLMSLSTAKRKPVSLSRERLVREEALAGVDSLPLVLTPAVQGVELVSWAVNNREFIAKQLYEHGGILFRGFPVKSADEFSAFIRGISGELLEYRERSSPRSLVQENIYTSTDYPADQSIFPHNENSYQRTWPLKIFFYCATAARRGGETPICDTRRVFQRIDPEIRSRFMERNVMYVRNFGEGIGLPWPTVFQTENRSEVEEYCRTHGIEMEWKPNQQLQTRHVGPAVVRHPRTGEFVWFNHATFFHISTLDASIREALLSMFDEADLPNNTYYGDGTPIEPVVLDKLRRAYLDEMVVFRMAPRRYSHARQYVSRARS